MFAYVKSELCLVLSAGQQKALAQAVIATGKPTVLLIFSGGLVDIEELRHADVAIVQAWFPGATGGTAVARTVFGLENRFGKLPFTVTGPPLWNGGSCWLACQSSLP
jgi:hypothetical protein